jgi:hypothetical protein
VVFEVKSTLENRVNVLKSLSATPSEIEELLAYNENLFVHQRELDLPLPDEIHIATWERYRKEAETKGVFRVLQSQFPQLRFPIREGISNTENYRAATRRGVPVEADGFSLEQPDALQLNIYQTPAGKIPLLYSGNRQDFISLVRALTKKNEPVPIPDSMGAQIVSGYNNWGRIREYRSQWEKVNPGSSWEEEFRRLIPRRELYQDTFVILSDNEYSGIPASDLGLEPSEWRRLSLIIRREHECAHYLTRRLFGSMRNNMLDELIADYAGIVKAFGRYRADIFLRFIGLENFPESRPRGRIENYRGNPPLSDGAFDVLKQLVVKAAHNLECFEAERLKIQPDQGDFSMIIALTRLTMEELGSDAGGCFLQEA